MNEHFLELSDKNKKTVSLELDKLLGKKGNQATH
jgi:hypothetical protein